MKTIKTVILGATALAAGAALADAQTRLNFTGSTAYRGATVNAIHAAFDSGTLAYAYTGSAASSGNPDTGANAGVYTGTIGGVSFVVKTFWTGSEAGIQAVAQDSAGVALNYVEDTPTKGGAGTEQPLVVGTPVSGIDDPTSGAAGTYTAAVPDVDMADTYQGTSQFKAGSFNGHSYPALTGATVTGTTTLNGIMGVVPFVFVVSPASTITNATSQLVRSLYANGSLPKALFTGSNADEGSLVYAVGRDPDSGTRLTSFAETGYGATKSVFQYEPLTSGSAVVTSTNSTVASLEPWPDETVNGTLISSPNGGYNSGGKLAGALGASTSGMVIYSDGVNASGTNGDLFGYLSTSDYGSKAGNAHSLAFNGVPFSTTAVQEGQYTFWSYEHMYYRTLTATQKTALTTIATGLYFTYATIPIPSMHCKRLSDGAAITAKY